MPWGNCVCNANGKLRAVRKQRLLIQEHRARSQVALMSAHRGRPIAGLTSHDVHFASRGLRHLGQILMCTIRTREPHSPAQSTREGRGGPGVRRPPGGGKDTDSGTPSLTPLGPSTSFCLFYSPQASFTVDWGFSDNISVTKRGGEEG